MKIIKYAILVTAICVSSTVFADQNDTTKTKIDREEINKYVSQNFNLDIYKSFYQPFSNWPNSVKLENPYIYDQNYSYDDTYTSSIEEPEVYEENTKQIYIGAYTFDNDNDETKKIMATDFNNKIREMTISAPGSAKVDKNWAGISHKIILHKPGTIENLDFNISDLNKEVKAEEIDKKYAINEKRTSRQSIIEIPPHSKVEAKVYLNISKVRGNYSFITPLRGDVSVLFNAVDSKDKNKYYDQPKYESYVAKFSIYDLLSAINLNLTGMTDPSSLPDDISFDNWNKLVLLKGHGTYYTEEATSVKIVKQIYDSEGNPGINTSTIAAVEKV